MNLKRIVKPIALKVFNVINELYFRSFFASKREALRKNNVLCSSLPGERILVLAPHIDDDIIGCGGAVLKYLQQGKEVFIAYVTDSGKRGTSGLNRDEIKNERRLEAIKVSHVMGLDERNLLFLGGEDGNLINSHIIDSLAHTIREVNPDTIFLPVLLDTHADHFGVTEKLCRLYEMDSEMLERVNLYLYESQSPVTQIYSNTNLDITDCFHKKKELLAFYKSQRCDFKFITSLNKVNGILFGGGIKCEIFINTKMDKYFHFYNNHFRDYASYLNIKRHLVVNSDSRYLIKSYASSVKYKKLLEELTQ